MEAPTHNPFLNYGFGPLQPSLVSPQHFKFPPTTTPLILTLPSYGIGYLYPSYTAYRLLEQNAANVELVEKLAIWCVVVCLMQLAARVLDPLFGFWLPLYHPGKVALIIWLVAPGTRGALRLFVKHVEPAIVRVEQELAALSRILDVDRDDDR